MYVLQKMLRTHWSSIELLAKRRFSARQLRYDPWSSAVGINSRTLVVTFPSSVNDSLQCLMCNVKCNVQGCSNQKTKQMSSVKGLTVITVGSSYRENRLTLLSKFITTLLSIEVVSHVCYKVMSYYISSFLTDRQSVIKF